MKRIITWMILILVFSCATVMAAKPVTPSSSTIDEGQLKELQTKMRNDSQIMDLILALQNDPDFMGLLNDPVFVQAITTRNVDVIANDSRFTKLLSNPLVKEIMQHVEK